MEVKIFSKECAMIGGKWIGVFFMTAALVFVGCGDSSDGGGDNAVSSSSAVSVSSANSSAVSSSAAVSSESSSAASSSSIAANESVKLLSAVNTAIIASLIDGIPSILEGMNTSGSVAAAPQRAPLYTNSCSGGGTQSVDLGANNAYIVTFDQCIENGVTMNGTITMSNVSSGSDSFSGNYEFQEFTISENGSLIYMDGTMNASATTSGSELSSFEAVISATFEISEGGETGRFVFTNYTASMNNSQYSVNGQVSIQNDPNICEANGDYTVQTVVPLTIDGSGNISGEIKVNNVTIFYNGDGTATVDGETISLSELDSCTA